MGKCEKMKAKGQKYFYDPDRSVCIVFLEESRISQAKRKTALYKLTEGSSFSKMSLDNEFVFNPTENIKSLPIREYKPLVTVGEITIYKHKSERKYYVSEHRLGDPPEYSTDDISLRRYRKNYGFNLNLAYMRNIVTFENMLTKSLFELYTI